MKLAYNEIGRTFEISDTYINTIIIENRRLLYEFAADLYQQSQGFDGKSVLSNEDTPISISKNLEVIKDFIDFDINRKPLISKITAALENVAIDAEHYLNTCHLISEIEENINEWSFRLPCNIAATKVNISNIIKSAGVEILNDYTGIAGQAEKIIDYMELVREYDRDKLFVTINIRSFFDDETMKQFIKTIIDHEYKVFMIENHQYNLLPYEKRLTIDEDLCEF